MRYFPRISPNSLKLSPKLRANVKFQSSTHAYLFIKTKLCLLHSKVHFISFNLIYWTPICGKYSLECSILEKCGKIWKNGCFSGWLWPDWGNTAWAAMVGSIGLMQELFKTKSNGRTARTMASTTCI